MATPRIEDTMNTESIISKIRKCLALSKSSNEHEAAVALRQAQALMEKYNIDEGTLLTAEVSEAHAKSTAKNHPAQWESLLANTIKQAFGVKPVFTAGRGIWKFIGTGPAPEIAQYAFVTLLRQLKKERVVFLKVCCRRTTPKNKTRRADLFCEAWVQSVWQTVKNFAGSEESKAAIEAYMQKNYPSLETLKTTDRQKDKPLNIHDLAAHQKGREAGKNVRLNHGVSRQGQTQLQLN
jgi:hypothetical protein